MSEEVLEQKGKQVEHRMMSKSVIALIVISNILHAQSFWEPVLSSVNLIVCLAENSRGYLFATSYTSGVFRSTDGGVQWTAVNQGLSFSSAIGFSVNPLNDDLYVSSGNRIYSSSNNGDSWMLRDSTSFPYGAWRIASSRGGALFALWDTLRRSLDGGETWAIAHNGLPFGSMQDLQIDPHGNVYVARHNDWVFRSTDSGDSWIPLDSPAPPLPFVDADAIAFGRNGELYVGDDGDGFFKSTDDGNSWQQLNTGLPNSFVWALAVGDGDNLFAGLARDGVSRSTNGGVQWDSINTGLDPSSRRVCSLLIARNGHLFAGTVNGLYRTVHQVTETRSDMQNHILGFSLSRNYPNPFNPATTIPFSIGKRVRTCLVIFDVLGREIATIVDKETNPGNYEIGWNAAGVASGVYVYRLTAGSFVASHKMMIAK